MSDYYKERKKYENELKAFKFVEDGLRHQKLGEIENAIESFQKAANSKTKYANFAQSKLGNIFDDANPASSTEAVYWYKRAVRSGDFNSAWDLAMHYKDKMNKRWYLHWLKVADRMGEPDAKNEIETQKWWKKKESELP